MKSIYLSLIALILVPTITFSQQKKVMTPELLWELGRVGLEAVSPDGSTFVYGVSHYDTEKNSGERNLFLKTINNPSQKIQLTHAKGSEYGVSFIKNGKAIGYAANGAYNIMDLATKSVTTIATTEKGMSGIKAYDLPDGKIALLFTKSVKIGNTTADLYPDFDKAEVKIIDDLLYRHWDHWSDKNYNHLNIAYYDPKTGKLSEAKDLMEGEAFNSPVEPFGGSESYTLSPDGKTVVYEAKKMSGKEWATSTNSDLYAYDVASGKTTNITVENKGYDKSPQFSPDGSKLAWTSMKTPGYESDVNDIVIMDWASKKQVRLLATTNLYDELTFNDYRWANENTMYATVPKDGTNQIYKINLSDGKPSSKNPVEPFMDGQHNYNHFEMAGQNIIVSRQDMNHASELFTISLKKKAIAQVTHVNDEIYSNLEMSKVEKRMVKTNDDKEMLTWVIYPPNFDPNKKYPTLLYCQGGPQSQVSQFYSFRWNFQLMAAKGYIIVAPNRRGLPGYGREWNEKISGDWGGQPMDDYLSAIDEVSKESFVDKENLGCIGASYGGYSVYYLAGNHDKRFSAFISHCGLFDLENWYLTTEEMFFANQDIGGGFWEEENKESYKKYDPKNFVQNWDTPMLVIHGGMDFRVPEAQGMAAFQAAQLRDVPSKFVYFPNEGHWILSPQNGLIWHDQFFGWLDQWLKK